MKMGLEHPSLTIQFPLPLQSSLILIKSHPLQRYAQSFHSNTDFINHPRLTVSTLRPLQTDFLSHLHRLCARTQSLEVRGDTLYYPVPHRQFLPTHHRYNPAQHDYVHKPLVYNHVLTKNFLLYFNPIKRFNI